MNAQEAIEIMQVQVDGHKRMINLYTGQMQAYSDIPSQVEYWKELKEEEEAQYLYKSIVLESAKLFHEYSVPEMFKDLEHALGIEEVKTVETVYGIPIEQLGIEVEE